MKRRILELVRDNQSSMYPGDVYSALSNGKQIKNAIEDLLDEGLIEANQDGTLRAKEREHELYQENLRKKEEIYGWR